MASRRHTAKLALPMPAVVQDAPIAPVLVETANATFDYTEHRELAEVTNCLGETIALPRVTNVERRLEITIPETAVHAYHEHDGYNPRTPIPERLQNIVIEHAYEAYAAGSGDNLGPCTVRHVNGNYTLSYVYSGQTQVTANLSPNWVVHQYQTAATNADTVYLTGNQTNDIILNEWLPAQEMGRYAQVRGSTTNGTPIPARGHSLYENFNTIMNGDGNDVFVQLTERGRMQANGLPYNPGPALSSERLQVINKKAQELLLQHLSEAQRKTWLAEAYFDLLAPSGRRYRLQKGHFHNVFLLDLYGNKTREYCAYARDPGGPLPAEDNVFAQMLTLMYNENEFLAHANTWDLSPGKKVFVGQGRDVYLPEMGVAAA